MRTPYLTSFCALFACSVLGTQAHAQTQVLDLRADDPSHISVNAGGQVTSWQNEDNAAQFFTPPTPAQAPTFVSNAINGLPAVQFDGINNVLSDIGFGESVQELTLFVVAAPLSNAGSYRAFFSGIDSSTPGHQDYSSGINFDMTSSASASFDRLNLEGAKGGGGGGVSFSGSGTSSTFGAFNLLTVGYGNTTDTVYVNGTAVGSRSGNTNTVSLQDVRIGARYYDNGGGPYESGYLNGDIAEVIAYNGLLTDAQIQAENQSLTQKYFTPAAAPAVPEPGPLALLTLGLLPVGLLLRARRRA